MPKKTSKTKARRPAIPGRRIQNKAIDPGHDPFKRTRKLGPGPRSGRNEQASRYECEWDGPYTQVCYYIKKDGDEGRKIVHVNPKWKKQYNKDYWKHITKQSDKHGGKPRLKNTRIGKRPARKSAAPKRKRRK